MIPFENCTIIIPHFGADEQQETALDQCFLSLKDTVPDIKIIIATNGRRCTQHDRGHIELYEQGQCKAVNAAVATTNTEWIFVSNDDMVYANNWWQRLTSFYIEGKNKFFCISPKLVEPKQGAPTFIVKPFGGVGDFNKIAFENFARERDNPAELYKTGFNLPFLIRRDLWDTIGGYDVNFDPWGSNGDSDLEYKIKLAGVQPYQSQDCVVYHFSQTSGTFSPDNQGWWQKNWNYFIEKWGFERTDKGIWEADFIVPDKSVRIFKTEWEGKYDKL